MPVFKDPPSKTRSTAKDEDCFGWIGSSEKRSRVVEGVREMRLRRKLRLLCWPNSAPALGGLVDAIYCINLQEQPKRFADAQSLFHSQGVCGDVIFYPPTRGRHSSLAIWTSHREVSREALRRGQQRVLVLEDDLCFLRGWASIVDAIRCAVSRLPSGWFALYLSHSPLQGYFVGRGVMRVSSSTTHAYVANSPLLDWVDATEPMDPDTAIRPRLIGRGIDSAFACLPGMFALFP